MNPTAQQGGDYNENWQKTVKAKAYFFLISYANTVGKHKINILDL